MNPYEQIKSSLLNRPKKITKKAVFFLNDNGEPFAGINKAGVWMSVSKVEGNKKWYSYMATKDEEILRISELKYSEQSLMAQEIVEKLLVSKE